LSVNGRRASGPGLTPDRGSVPDPAGAAPLRPAPKSKTFLKGENTLPNMLANLRLLRSGWHYRNLKSERRPGGGASLLVQAHRSIIKCWSRLNAQPCVGVQYRHDCRAIEQSFRITRMLALRDRFRQPEIATDNELTGRKRLWVCFPPCACGQPLGVSQVLAVQSKFFDRSRNPKPLNWAGLSIEPAKSRRG